VRQAVINRNASNPAWQLRCLRKRDVGDIGKSIAQGAATTCYVATSPQLGNISGEYFEDCNAVTVLGDNHMHDAAQATHLWQVSETITKDYLDELKWPDRDNLENGLGKSPGT